jgi:hypothetical protein
MTQQRVSPITVTSQLPATATLTLQGATGQSAKLLDVKTSAGTSVFSVDNSGVINDAISTTELGYLDGVTSAIQTQLDAKIPKTLTTTTGDIIYASSANTPARLGIGTSSQVLTVSGGVPAWATPAGGGKVLQVVSGTYGTATTITTTTFTDTGLSLSITPTSATSKILVLIMQQMSGNRTGVRMYANTRLLRGGTTLLGVDGNATFGLYAGGSDASLFGQFNTSYLDSPATTSSTTYKTQGQVYEATGSANVIYNQQMTSTITLIEIGA